MLTYYLFLFLLGGLSLVAIQYCASLNHFYLAGIIAIAPLKTLLGLIVVSNNPDKQSIRQTVYGAGAGAISLILMLVIIYLLESRIGALPAILTGFAAWIFISLSMRSFFY